MIGGIMQADKFAINHNRAYSLLKYTPGIISCAGFLLLAASFLHPFASENSHAASSNISVSYTATDWTLSAPTSTAADAGGISLEFTPDSDGTNIAAKDTVTGGATNVPDYQIYVSVNTAGGTIPNTTDSTHAIAATSGTVTDATSSSSIAGAAALSSNSWGFALSSFNTGINYNDLVSSSDSTSWSSSKWSKLPYIATEDADDSATVEADATKIYDSNTSSSNTVDVYYAVNANNALASGDYQTTVTYTLIGEIPTQTESFGITNMQDPSVASHCSAATITTSESDVHTYKLVDTRNTEKYYIRKFTFGSSDYCIMVQNLYLTSGTTLTTNDSNVSDSYTLDGSTMVNGSRYTEGGSADGSWYSFTTAVAGSYTVPSEGTTQEFGYDLCPKYWRLPNSSEYSYISSKVNSAGINSFFAGVDGSLHAPIYSGYYLNGALTNDGANSWWWTNAAHTTSSGMGISAYAIRAANDILSTSETTLYYGGSRPISDFHIRCLVQAVSS